MKRLIKRGLILLALSNIFRIATFIYIFGIEHETIIVKLIVICFGVLFIALWFFYGYILRLGFGKSLLVGLIGASDGILLSIITFIKGLWTLHVRVAGYVAFWKIPFIGFADGIYVERIAAETLYVLVIIVLLLIGMGGFIGKKISNGIHK